jgi:hypothetical protein
MTTKLGQLLVAEGLLSEGDRKTIQEASGNAAGSFAKGILALGLLNEEELAAFLADRTHYRVAAKDIFSEIDDRALGAIDTPLLRQLEVLPLRLDSNVLAVAMIDPLDRAAIRQLEFFTGCKIKPLIATLRQVRTGLERLIPGYKPVPSAFEAFMATHMPALETAVSRTGRSQDRAKEMASQMLKSPAAKANLAPGQFDDGFSFSEDDDQDGNTQSQVPEITPDTTATDTAGPAIGELDTIQPTPADPQIINPPSAGETEASVASFSPKFTIAPALVGNEALANKSLLDLNKKLMELAATSGAQPALNLLVDSLFKIGINAGCIALHMGSEANEGPPKGTVWSGTDSAAAPVIAELHGNQTPTLLEAIANHAPEAIESDGWLQIPVEEDAAIKCALDLIKPDGSWADLQNAINVADSVVLARAIKMAGKGDLVSVLIWPNASAGHGALRAAASNALRAYTQKLKEES